MEIFKEPLFYVVVIVVVILAYFAVTAPGVAEIDRYEQCVQEKYGMTSAEAYQKLGVTHCYDKQR